MSDIVETLRKGDAESVDGWWFVMAEAANEIERLRAENEKLREKEKDYLEMLQRQAQTIVKLWKMMGSIDKMESGE